MTVGLETFAKVRALHDGSTIPGEKAAAMTRMQTLARKAGMSVDEAVSTLDAPKPVIVARRTVDMGDFFNTPYFRQQMAKREQERAARWREVLEEYRTEEAVFEPGPMERALDAAAALFGPNPGWHAYPLSDVPPAIVATVEAAWPMPGTVREAWVEFAFWDKLGSDREARGSACGDHSPAVQIRCSIVERVLDEMPALSLNDLRARVSWLEFLDTRNAREHGTRLATLRADIERIREQGVKHVQSGRAASPTGSGEPSCTSQGRPVRQQWQAVGVQSGQATNPIKGQSDSVDQTYPVRRTNADKRRAVLALLTIGKSDSDRLTDREIARRTGVSPTTVGTIRRSLA